MRPQSLERVTSKTAASLAPVDVELDPPQPSEIVDAIAEALEEPRDAADPWWQAGIDEALGS